MNKALLRIGGVINLLFVLLHLAMVKPLREALASIAPEIQPTASTLNIHVAYTLLIFGCLGIFWTRDLLTSRLGNFTVIAVALFWLLRAVNQGIFYGVSAADMPLIGICLFVGLLHLIPVIRVRKTVLGPSKSLAVPHA